MPVHHGGRGIKINCQKSGSIQAQEPALDKVDCLPKMTEDGDLTGVYIAQR